MVPFGPRIASVLTAYRAAAEARRGRLSPEMPFFSFTRRGAIHPCTITQTFHHLVPRLQLVIPDGVASPRLHDLCHSFAVGTLLRWYRTGVDPQARLLHLATFLGHVDPASMAVYLTITPALLAEASVGITEYERMRSPNGTDGANAFAPGRARWSAGRCLTAIDACHATMASPPMS